MSGDPLDGAKEDLEVAREAIADASEKLEQTEAGSMGDSAKPADGIDLSGGGGPPGGGSTED